jgi:hypothetical protein
MRLLQYLAKASLDADFCQYYRYLETVRTAVKPTSSDSASKLPSDGFHTLALAGRVEQLAYEIYVATQHTIPPQTTDASIELLTPGEQLAHEVSLVTAMFVSFVVKYHSRELFALSSGFENLSYRQLKMLRGVSATFGPTSNLSFSDAE